MARDDAPRARRAGARRGGGAFDVAFWSCRTSLGQVERASEMSRCATERLFGRERAVERSARRWGAVDVPIVSSYQRESARERGRGVLTWGQKTSEGASGRERSGTGGCA